MRKLLVASQKGGVGKTTTSINLAAAAAAAAGRVLLLDADPLSNVSTALRLANHPRRQSLRGAGSAVPGSLVSDLVPGLDVFSPYEDAGCSDDDFENVIRLLKAPEIRDGYDCVIVDAPPFLGAKPAQLLATCEEYILVMRAEANAHRTLPALQELVQRSKRGGKAPQMLGILLTLPEGETVGGRWERELRGRLGSRVLTDVIPFDGQEAEARDAAQILLQSHPEAPSATAYTSLVEGLALSSGTRAVRSGESPILRAAAVFKLEAPVAADVVVAAAPQADVSEKTELPAIIRRALPPVRRAPPPPEPAEEPELSTDYGSMMSMPEIPVLRLPRSIADKPTAAVGPSRRNASEPSKKQADRSAPEPKRPINPAPPLMWIGAAMVMGFGLRFVYIPPRLVPLVIGAAVTAAVLLVLRLLLTPNEPSAPVATSRSSTPRRSNESKKTAAPPKEVNARLAAIARRPRRE